MSMRMAITNVLCCLVLIAILMNAMPISVLAMNSNSASNSVSNHSDPSVSLSSNRIYVPDEYLAIQAAVNAASPNNTIIVRNGLYTENVDVNKPLTIYSENDAAGTIVLANKSNNPMSKVTADYVDIRGFTVKCVEWAPGIYHINVDRYNVINNYISNNYNGITFMHSSGNMVSNNSPMALGSYTLILHATDERGNRASPKQCNITAVSSTGSAIFDTGEETYTYPCKETDGHSEYVKIWNSTWKGVEAYFLGGEITSQEFEDTKGHLNNNWIPAIKLKEV